MTPAIFIPARLGSQRLANKVMADIAGKPLLVHVWEAACRVASAPVFIASGDEEISAMMEARGARIIKTPADCASGSDRIINALNQEDPDAKLFDPIVNLQGDMVNLDPQILVEGLNLIARMPEIDILTPVIRIEEEADITRPEVVKVAIGFNDESPAARALYFSRSPIPHHSAGQAREASEANYYHHIGIYFYRRAALSLFGQTKPSLLEQTERLEQLRALEAGLAIYGWRVHKMPFSIDNSEDLVRVRQLYEKEANGQ